MMPKLGAGVKADSLGVENIPAIPTGNAKQEPCHAPYVYFGCGSRFSSTGKKTLSKSAAMEIVQAFGAGFGIGFAGCLLIDVSGIVFQLIREGLRQTLTTTSSR